MPSRIYSHSFISIFAIIVAFWGYPANSAIQVLEEGDVLMVSDESGSQYGALKIEEVNSERRSLVYRWYLPPAGVVAFNTPDLRSGTMEIQQVRGRGIVAFGPFVLEWHGTEGKRAVIGANGELGVNPIRIATSGIKDPPIIQDARSGYQYEFASIKESNDPLGIQDTLSNLPKARVGFTVADTIVDFGDGSEEPAVKIIRIDQESDAFKQGVRKGQVILAFNGVDVMSSKDFHDQLKIYDPKDTATITVWRDGSYQDLTFSTEARLQKPAISEADGQQKQDLTPEEKVDQENKKEVRNLIEQSLEALRAVHYD
ncbi:MAG: PDZ domain-containing protein [Candidatus Omnitrophica bacterium]|nr:PDZ domain-containing protein [Candidatus Omnitrophota bacterium]